MSKGILNSIINDFNSIPKIIKDSKNIVTFVKELKKYVKDLRN